MKAKEYSSCFLPESCGQYGGISCILIQQEPILVFAQSFGFGSVQPLHTQNNIGGFYQEAQETIEILIKETKKIFLIRYWKAVSRNTGNYSITYQIYTEHFWKVLSRSKGNH